MFFEPYFYFPHCTHWAHFGSLIKFRYAKLINGTVLKTQLMKNSPTYVYISKNKCVSRNRTSGNPVLWSLGVYNCFHLKYWYILTWLRHLPKGFQSRQTCDISEQNLIKPALIEHCWGWHSIKSWILAWWCN